MLNLGIATLAFTCHLLVLTVIAGAPRLAAALTARAGNTAELYAAFSNHSVDTVYVDESVELDGSEWPGIVELNRSFTISASPERLAARTYVAVNFNGLRMLYSMAPNFTLTYRGIELTGHQETVGAATRVMRMSPGALVVADQCIQRRKVGLPYKAAYANQMASPRPASAPPAPPGMGQEVYMVPRVSYNVTSSPGAPLVFEGGIFQEDLWTEVPEDYSLAFQGLYYGGYQYHAIKTYTVADHLVPESCLLAMSGSDCITLLLHQLEANNGTLRPPPPPKSPPAAAGAGSGGGGGASSSRVTLIVAVCVVVPLVLLAAMATALCWWRRRHDWLAGQQKRSGNDIEARVGEAGLTSGASVGVEGGSGAAVRQPYGVAGQGGCVFLGTGEGQGSTEWTHEDELEEEQEEEEKEAVDSKQLDHQGWSIEPVAIAPVELRLTCASVYQPEAAVASTAATTTTTMVTCPITNTTTTDSGCGGGSGGSGGGGGVGGSNGGVGAPRGSLDDSGTAPVPAAPADTAATAPGALPQAQGGGQGKFAVPGRDSPPRFARDTYTPMLSTTSGLTQLLTHGLTTQLVGLGPGESSSGSLHAAASPAATTAGAGGGGPGGAVRAQAGECGRNGGRGDGAAAPVGSVGLPAAPSSPPDPLMHEWGDMVASVRGRMREPTIRLEAILGSGAFGTVYKGTWQGLVVAVKTVVFSATNEHKRRALQEAALCQAVSHPNIVATYMCDVEPVGATYLPAPAGSRPGAGTTQLLQDWRLYMVQELCDGGPMRRLYGDPHVWPPGGQVNMPAVLSLALGVSRALAHLHSKRVVHGDLNPNNVLLARDPASPCGWTPKVADFGLSFMLPEQRTHVSNLRMGTMFYVCPAVILKAQVGPPSDVFSLGVLLWELWHGRTAGVATPSGPRYRPSFPTFPPTCPPAYRALTHHCLHQEPFVRPTAEQVEAQLAVQLAACSTPAPTLMPDSARLQV